MEQPLPFSQASENNKHAILAILKRHLDSSDRILEIGGGTGQHAVFFTENLSGPCWQSSDIPANIDNLNLRIKAAQLVNLPEAFALDVNSMPWECQSPTAMFSANSLHIMSIPSVENFFSGVEMHLQPQGKLLVYGPFKYGGEYTAPSNAGFDQWLKSRDPESGIRDFEWINSLAEKAGLSFIEDNSMPANNQLLVWKKTTK